MALDKTDIEKIANLARIDINEADIPVYADNLSKIITFVEQMNSVDTNDVEPMAHPLEVTARLRDDAVTETDQRENFQKVAPKTEDGLYLVPKVIE
ncbi:MAG: Asp-tRNA(Asn)/Glu-tRNA(Gln) amidotransferase subunit GatC [Pseudomonadota bacterium]